jgi:hypothetical protein
MIGGVCEMARKSGPKGGRPKLPDPKKNIVTLRGSEAFRDWLNNLADHCRLPASAVIDQALIAYARQQGFDQEPPKR